MRLGGRRRGPPPFGRLPGEAEVVERIRQLRADGLSLRKIADALNAESAPTRTGAPWSKMMVKAVLDRLGQQALSADGLTVHTTDLDDVFFALTGSPQQEQEIPA